VARAADFVSDEGHATTVAHELTGKMREQGRWNSLLESRRLRSRFFWCVVTALENLLQLKKVAEDGVHAASIITSISGKKNHPR